MARGVLDNKLKIRQLVEKKTRILHYIRVREKIQYILLSYGLRTVFSF